MKKQSNILKVISVLSLLLALTSSYDSSAQTKTCEELNGTWYYCYKGAKEPIVLVFSGCNWKDSNPMGIQRGTAKYSSAKKKFQITGLADADSGPVFLTNAKDYSYLSWVSSWTNERTYIVLTRTKQSGRWYSDVYKRLEASGK